MKDWKGESPHAASPTSQKASKELKKKLPKVEVVMKQPRIPKARSLSPDIASSTPSTSSSNFQAPQCPKTPPHRQATQKAVDEFSRASAKFRQSSRISLHIQDELSKRSRSSIASRAASPSSYKNDKKQLDVLLSIDHKLGRILETLEVLVESIPLSAR